MFAFMPAARALERPTERSLPVLGWWKEGMEVAEDAKEQVHPLLIEGPRRGERLRNSIAATAGIYLGIPRST